MGWSQLADKFGYNFGQLGDTVQGWSSRATVPRQIQSDTLDFRRQIVHLFAPALYTGPAAVDEQQSNVRAGEAGSLIIKGMMFQITYGHGGSPFRTKPSRLSKSLLVIQALDCRAALAMTQTPRRPVSFAVKTRVLVIARPRHSEKLNQNGYLLCTALIK